MVGEGVSWDILAVPSERRAYCPACGSHTHGTMPGKGAATSPSMGLTSNVGACLTQAQPERGERRVPNAAVRGCLGGHGR